MTAIANLHHSLPTSLARKCAQLSRSVSGLRPDYVRAVGHLIDASELFIQHGANICLAALSRGTPTVDPKFAEWIERTLLAVPLSFGHFLEAWKRSAEAILACDREMDRPFRSAATFVHEKSKERLDVLATVDQLPVLRNRKKGHTFTLSPGDAEAVCKEWAPKFQRVLDAARFLSSDLSIAVVSEVAERENLVEVLLLAGDRGIDTAPSSILQTPDPMKRHDVVAIPASSITSAIAEEGGCLVLSPLMRYKADDVFFFQGVRGKKATYLSVSASEDDDARYLADLHARFAPIINVARQARPRNPEPPAWASGLVQHDLLCDAIDANRKPNAEGFFRGAMPNWADLRENLDVPRTVLNSRGEQILYEGLTGVLTEGVGRAKRNEVPVYAIVGHAGSGKTTLLLRVAFDLYRELRDKICVLRHRIGIPLTLDDYLLANKQNPDAVIVALVDEAHEIQAGLPALRANAMAHQLPLLLLCAERRNLWECGLGDQFELTQLALEQIAGLIERLSRFDMLGSLKSLGYEHQVAVIRDKLDRQLLIALREATEGKRFDEILIDEYRRIPSDKARLVYFAACLLQTAGGALPDIAARSLADVSTRRDEFRLIEQPCKGVLVAGRIAGARVFVARHSLIAATVAREAIPDRDELFLNIAYILHALCGQHRDDPRREDIDLAVKLFASEPVQAAISAGTDPEPLIECSRAFGRSRCRLLGRLFEQESSSSKWTAFCLAIFLDLSDVDHLSAQEPLYMDATLAFERVADTANAIIACERGIQSLGERGIVASTLYRRLSDHREAKGELDAAIDTCLQGMAAASQIGVADQNLYFRLSVLRERGGDQEGAIRACEDGIRAVGGSVRRAGTLYYRLSLLEERRGNLERAVEVCRLGLAAADSSTGDRTSLLYRLCRAYLRRGDWEPLIQIALQDPIGSHGLGAFELGHFIALSDDSADLEGPEAVLARLSGSAILTAFKPSLIAGALNTKAQAARQNDALPSGAKMSEILRRCPDRDPSSVSRLLYTWLLIIGDSGRRNRSAQEFLRFADASDVSEMQKVLLSSEFPNDETEKR